MSLVETITQYLDKIKWKYHLENEQQIKFGVKLDKIKLDCLFDVQQENNIVLFYSVFPIMVDYNLRNTISEYITRANFGLKIGNLEMDFKDGEIRYKTYANTDFNCFNEAIVRHILHANIQTFDRYIQGIVKILFANYTAEEAIHLVEQLIDVNDIDISELKNLL
ncbi:MAG: hypothetical protein H6553_03875 [Chitinophagales bacterium]|nr:hypothetical protein [Chitinophagales bacterium]